jgi:hypothetical protein
LARTKEHFKKVSGQPTYGKQLETERKPTPLAMLGDPRVFFFLRFRVVFGYMSFLRGENAMRFVAEKRY